ncbi:MAG: right-handed parallel beta-helix repeat-containing protein [Chloroflexi bacterium]|nr:right-handed parallel beta-helix repeat-containing protein [Chloroflexota bacterium]
MKKLVLLTLLAMYATSCSAPTPTAPAPTAIAIAPGGVAANTPTARPSATATEIAPTATNAPSATPTLEPTPTTTNTPIPTATLTPTPLPVREVAQCAEIWQPGYYKLVADIKTSGTRDCFPIQSHNVIFDCNNHVIEGKEARKDKKYEFYGFFVRKFNFPFLETPTNIEIKNCKIRYLRTGIFVGGGNNVYIHDNDLSNNRDDTDERRYGVFLGQADAGGLRLDTVNGGIVEKNITNNQAIGIDVRDSQNVIVRNNTAAVNSAWGINFINVQNSEISGNTLRDNIRWCTWGAGTVAPGCDAGGIILQTGSSNNVVRGNLVEGENGNGIFIKAHAVPCGDNNVIEGNRILNAKWNAIEFSFCKGNKVIGNEISGSYDAVWFGFSDGTEIRNNIITNMTNHGIISYNSRNTTVANNTIVNSREGIYFYWDTWDAKQFFFLTPSPDRYASRNNLIANNTLHDNAVAGIRMQDSVNNRLESNVLFRNGRDFQFMGRAEGNVIITPTPPPTPTATATFTPTLIPSATTAPTLTATPTLTPTNTLAPPTATKPAGVTPSPTIKR